MRLGLAYEYDSYLFLSIARADSLPHKLEAVVAPWHERNGPPAPAKATT